MSSLAVSPPNRWEWNEEHGRWKDILYEVGFRISVIGLMGLVSYPSPANLRSNVQGNEAVTRSAARTGGPAASEAVDDACVHQEGCRLRLGRAPDRLTRASSN